MNLPQFSDDAPPPPLSELVSACDTMIAEKRAWLAEFGHGAPANRRHGSMGIQQQEERLNALLWLRKGYATALARQRDREAAG